MSKKLKSVCLLGIFGLSISAFGHSARRQVGEDWRQASARQRDWRILREDSAQSAAGPYEDLSLEGVPVYSDAKELQSLFEQARDDRFIEWSRRPGFLRRSTWLYPDDGCFARAALVNQHFEQWNKVRPMKLFAFGNLHAETDNAPSGSVQWWFHVVPVVSNGKELIVLDPALNPHAPLSMIDWLKRMSRNPKEIMVSLCNTYSYAPEDSCLKAGPNTDAEALSEQKDYLGSEWTRLTNLGRDPEQELGENPPWAN